MRRVGPQTGQRARDVLQVPGEVLTTQALRRGDDGLRTQCSCGGLTHDLHTGGLVDGRRYTPPVGDLGLGPIGGGDRIHQLLHQVGGGVPGLVVETAHSALGHSVVRDDVGGRTRADPPPHQAEPGPRVDQARQRGGKFGDDLAQCVDQVGGQVRTGGVATGTRQPDHELVTGRGDTAGAQTDLSDQRPRIAMQGEETVDPFQRTGVEDLHGPTRQFLGGLEDQPDPAR